MADVYLPGHVGIALVVYAPVGYYLVRRRRVRLAASGAVVVAGLTLAPDADLWLPGVVHRGRTHTVWFALAVGGLLGTAAAIARRRIQCVGGSCIRIGAASGFLGTLAILAHLLGDLITPMGIRPLYPVSDASYTADLVYASDPAANAGLFALGCLTTVAQFGLGLGIHRPATRREFVADVRRLAGVVRRGPEPYPLSAGPADDPARPSGRPPKADD